MNSKSTIAGIMIGLGGLAYKLSPNPIVGAFLFSFGLLIICYYQLNLFTGKIGYLFSYTNRDKVKLLPMLFENICGIAILATFVMVPKAPKIEYIQSTTPFISGLFCGVCVFIAVDLYKKNKNILGILIGVPLFIIAGFRHVIAEIFYQFLICDIAPVYIFKVLLGNSIGAIITNEVLNGT